MKQTIEKLLFELIKNSNRSDRDLAKVLGVSQPTITRMRNKLVKDGLIQEFSVIPDFVKIGFELLAISCVKAKIKADSLEKARKWVQKYPNVVLMARAEGMGKNGVIASLHNDYTHFSRFAAEAQEYWGDEIENYETLLISLKGIIVRPFSLKYLAKLIETSEE